MRLSADKATAGFAKTIDVLNIQSIGAGRVAKQIGLWFQSIGGGGLSGISHLRSGLVAGIGFINLYEVVYDGLHDLSALELDGFNSVRIGGLDSDKAQRLFEYLGDLASSEIYLLEYPDGYLLAHNNNLLAFKPHGNYKDPAY